MGNNKTLRRICDSKVISVIRADSSDECFKIVDAVFNAGIKAIEITMTVPNAVEIIEDVSKKFESTDTIIGVGTVSDAATAVNCITAGAEFIVSPIFDKQSGEVCNAKDVLYIPGAFTPNEIFRCMKAGFHFVKIFPASWIGANRLKELKGPFPSLEFLPTGGVNIENIKEWFSAGAIAVAVGSALTKYAKDGDFKKITATARSFLDAIE